MEEFTEETGLFQSELEDLVAQELLIELVNSKKAEVFENVVFQGKRRYYIEDLTERDYSLENTTPYQLEIMGKVVEEHAWGLLLCKTACLLLELFPDYKDKIFDFRCPWTKAAMFTSEQKTNYKLVMEGVYINCNHTALHSCWFLQDMLDFFQINKAEVGLLIHRSSSAEPKNVKEYIEKRFKKNFAHYICVHYNKADEYAQKTISNIEKYLNPMLKTVSKSYTNFFLFDDNATMSNYVKKVRENITRNMRFDDKAKKILNKYLDYLVEFYKE